MKEEITFELTNYCPHGCRYCSSNATTNLKKTLFLTITRIKKELKNNYFKRINLSGGEPLFHPNFYNIFILCKNHTKDVVVYSNLITHRMYNANVIDGVYLEANLTVTPETDKIHILRRVKQWKELTRPEVHLSRNHFESCSCSHRVIKPSGEITLTPCNKYVEKRLDDVYVNKYYITGAHGVGKSTIMKDLSNRFNFKNYYNTSKNPYTKNVFKRQLWRLMKYITDNEIIGLNLEKLVINRCCLDWLVYTKTFKELNWITEKQYNILLEKYNNYFDNNLPDNIIYINPSIDWSKKRLQERWKNKGIKWREDNFDYYDILRKNYDILLLEKVKKVVNLVEINEVNRINRISVIKKAII